MTFTRLLLSRFALAAIAISGSLTSCVSPPKALPPGSSVHFINAIPTEIDIQQMGLTSLFGRSSTRRQVPELAAMMRRVVMEEAQRAGLKCTYIEVQIPKPRLPGDQRPYVLEQIPTSAQRAQNAVTMVAFPGPNAAQAGYGSSSSGFAIEEQKGLIPALNVTSIRGALMVRRYDNPVVDKRKGSSFGMAGFGQGLQLTRVEGDTAWGTKLPVNRLAAMKYWEMNFREAVARVMGRSR